MYASTTLKKSLSYHVRKVGNASDEKIPSLHLSRGHPKNNAVTILKTQCISYHVIRKVGNTSDGKFHRSTFLGSKNIQVSRGNLLVVDSFYLFYHKA